MRAHSARACNVHLDLLRLNSACIEASRPGDFIFRRLRLASACLHSARTRDRKLQLLDVYRSDVESARAGDRSLEARALDAVDPDSAGSGNRCAAELRHGDDEVGVPVGRVAEMEEAVVVLGMDRELVALDFDHCALEQPL